MAKKQKPKKEKVRRLEFDYIKSNFFRVIHADGAFGGLAPNGSIHMSIFSERQSIPTKMVHNLIGNHLGPELKDLRQGRKCIVREVDVDIVLEVQQAIVVRDWLDRKIKERQSIVDPKPSKSNGKEKQK